MKKAGIITTLALAVVLGGCTAKTPVDTGDNDNAAVPVQVIKASTGTVSSNAGLSARLVPSQEIKIAPKVSGKITSLNLKIGQYVAQGTTLFTLDQTDLQNAVRQAQAGYELAQANLSSSGNNSSQAYQSAKNSLDQAKQALEDAKRNDERTTQLYQQGAVSAQQYEQSKTALKNAETAYANAVTSLQAAQKMSGVVVGEASVNQARVQLQNAQEQLANTSVKAPISGYISQVNGAVGEMAGPQAAVVTIVNLNPLKVKANLSETEITTVKLGSKVRVELPALSKEIDAVVTAVSPTMDPQTKAYPIEISVANPQLQLKADMIARVTFTGFGGQKPSIVVPRMAVFEESGKQIVYKLEGNKAKKVTVTTGEESSDSIEIKSGIAVGDTVVVRGLALLKDGSAVEIQTN